MKKNETENLRKCTLYYEDDKVFYFHGFAIESAIERHPEDPRGDLVYSRSCGILEDVDTGEVRMATVHAITFITK